MYLCAPTGLLIPAGLLVAVGFSGCSGILAVTFLTLSTTLGGISAAGVFINQIDIAPQYGDYDLLISQASPLQIYASVSYVWEYTVSITYNTVEQSQTTLLFSFKWPFHNYLVVNSNDGKIFTIIISSQTAPYLCRSLLNFSIISIITSIYRLPYHYCMHSTMYTVYINCRKFLTSFLSSSFFSQCPMYSGMLAYCLGSSTLLALSQECLHQL